MIEVPLLAVDVGLRAGLALFGADGKLVWYRSKHFGSRDSLRRHVASLLGGVPGLRTVALEGGGPLAEIWAKESDRRELTVVRAVAEDWRAALLPSRERTDGLRAKRFAGKRAHAVIAAAGAPRPTSLRHDAAEAILLGTWLLSR